MNLEKMTEMQVVLDAHITKSKGLDEAGNRVWKTLALDVELSELANEWRGFKKWSENRDPRTVDEEWYVPELATKTLHDDTYHRFYTSEVYQKDRNPLLEEYADCVSFFLSIANEEGWQDSLYLYEEAILDLEEEGLHGGITGAFLEVKYNLLKSLIEINPDENIEKLYGMTKQEFHFANAWFVFIAIGLIGFKLTEEQIERAYYDKNAVNFERQNSGY